MANHVATLNVFLNRTLAELRQIRDGNFDTMTSSEGAVVSSSVNGSSFQFSLNGLMSPAEIIEFCQYAIDYKMRGICRPITRTAARFN